MRDERHWQLSDVGDTVLGGRIEGADPDYVVVRSHEQLLCLRDEVLGEREHPVIGLTLRAYEHEPVLDAREIRSVVGGGVRIYLIADDDLLEELGELLGSHLRLDRGTVRLWGAGAGIRCDPSDHPVIVALEGEDSADTLEELGYQFDLSRPRVRGRISLIEDARALLEHELERAHEQNRKTHERLRDAQIECHGLRTRAEAAEASLAAAQPPTD
jgi:hypothetical protein